MYLHIHNDFTHCARRGWGLGTEDNVLNFEFAIMCINNIVFTNLCIMGFVFVISLTHQTFYQPASSPTPASFLCSGDISVVVVVLPSPSQAILI